MQTPEAMKDASHLYEVAYRAKHAERPGFRISELGLAPDQEIPWHRHTRIQDTFYVLEGELHITLAEPAGEIRLRAGATHAVAAGRPHRVRSAGGRGAAFLVLQGLGEYDFVPLPGLAGTESSKAGG